MSDNATPAPEAAATEATLLGTSETPTDGANAAAATPDKNVPANGDASTAGAAGNETNADGNAPPAAEAEGTKDSKSDGEAEDGETDEGVPEGDYSLKPPEGFDDLDAEDVAAFTPVAKELGLSNAKAQKLVDLLGPIITRRVEGVLKDAQDGQMAALRQTNTDWKSQAERDPEIGGADHKQKLGIALRGLEAFGTPELRQMLGESPFGSHPELVRFAYRAGLTVKEDGGLVRGAPVKSGTRKTDAEVFFPDLTNSSQG